MKTLNNFMQSINIMFSNIIFYKIQLNANLRIFYLDLDLQEILCKIYINILFKKYFIFLIIKNLLKLALFLKQYYNHNLK